ncbi:transcription initiation factor TFIID subunit 4 [Engraulis encrasicolus]|uniref:transcription initiation factor TFIID subunit 4 n=1 Tax=Engraulis encrasicolus TaxID=184585 RepID=UPI002FD715E0
MSTAANSSSEQDKGQSSENISQTTKSDVVDVESSSSSTGEGKELPAVKPDCQEPPLKATFAPTSAQSKHGEATSSTEPASTQVPAPPSQPSTGGGGSTTTATPTQVGSTICSSPGITLPKGQTTTTPPVPTTLRAVAPTPPRAPAPKSTMVMVRPPQQTTRPTASVQLPATFQIPPGMVLVRSDSGQLILVSQQALAQAQKAVGNTNMVQPSAAPAVRKPASAQPVIRVCLPVSGATPQRPSTSATGPSMQSMHRPSAPGKVPFRPSITAPVVGSGALRPTIVAAALGATTTTTLRPSSATGLLPQRPASGVGVMGAIRGTNPQRFSSTLGTGQQLISSTLGASTVKAKDGTTVSRPTGLAPRLLSVNVPTKPKAAPTDTVNQKTIENVKKCKNFLVTLMKLASSSSNSTDMGMNVRNLVKSLLDGKLEPEEFTDKLYKELKSSPQPYLVTFLKRSLPAVRQLTPDSELFIRQCEQTGSEASTSTPLSSSSISSSSVQAPQSVSISIQPSSSSSSSLRIAQQQPPKAIAQQLGMQGQHIVTIQRPTAALQPMVLGRGVSKLHTTKTAGVIISPSVQISKCPPGTLQPTVSVRESSGAFRDDDDINDVASMAGVSVSEERARILATGSESVGRVIRSCRDEPWLCPTALRSRITSTAQSSGAAGVEGEVVALMSAATEERLRDLLEKLTITAQHRNMQLRDYWQYQQASDVRGQLRYLEQVESLQQQRREEEEREMLLRIAKSRSGNAEMQCLKQKAKEMQQLELAQAQHRQANLAALAAIGPRRKRPLEGSGLLGLRSVARPVTVTRVTMRDLIFCMEQDAHLSRSLLLYSAMIK